MQSHRERWTTFCWQKLHNGFALVIAGTFSVILLEDAVPVAVPVPEHPEGATAVSAPFNWLPARVPWKVPWELPGSEKFPRILEPT